MQAEVEVYEKVVTAASSHDLRTVELILIQYSKVG
jgi:hypothetical protein